MWFDSTIAALLTLSVIVESSLADCVPRPIAARIGNVSLSNGNDARGIAYSVGTPAQNFAFLPQWGLNNILLYGVNGKCSGGSPKACTTTRGGQYDKVASSTREEAKQGQYPTDPDEYPQMDHVTDIFKLNSDTTLKDLQMGISFSDWGSKGYTPMMGFGMGANSTIFKALLSSNKIISRTWSYFFGWTGDQSATQLDGTWVWGGYDKAKVDGDGFEFAMSDDGGKCGTRLLVEIADMQLNFANGTTESLFTDSKTIKACLAPNFPVLMSMPLDPFFASFQNLTDTPISQRSLGIDWYSVLYDPDEAPYTGDMTFTFKDGPSVRIPNDQLIHAERTVDDSSGAIVANASAQNLLINPLQDVNADDLPQLGRQFFSSAYILVNEDTQKFKLWAANPTKEEDLVAIDKDGKEITDFCRASAPNPSSPSKPSQTGDTGKGGSSGLSGGAIGGVVVGVIAGIALLAAALFLLWRRRQQSLATGGRGAFHDSSTAINSGDPGGIKYVYAPHDHQNQYAELPQDHHTRTENYKPDLQGGWPLQTMEGQRRISEQYEMPG